MAKCNSDHDATEFYSIPWAGGNRSFQEMTLSELRKIISMGKEWEVGTPDWYDPWNGWGGPEAAKKTHLHNAKNAREEMVRRGIMSPLPDQIALSPKKATKRNDG